MSSATQENRVPLSLRLPIDEVEIIDSYASKKKTSKTDAFLHFLRKGIEAESSNNPQLAEVNKKLDDVLALLETKTHVLSQKDVASVVESIAGNHSAITRVYLFGSYARNEATEQSDVDLRIELDPNEPFSLFDLSRLKLDLEKAVGRTVDVITAKEITNKQLEKSIEKDKVLIYEREK